MNQYEAVANLMQVLRQQFTKKQSCLMAECLMYVAIKPRTYEELAVLTGAKSNVVLRSLSHFMVWVRKNKQTKEMEIMQPELSLFARKKQKSPLRGYQISLTNSGKVLLQQAGFVNPS